tara:strand:+ start:445 stop:795 length:351 start_codon:yes stop_codon:yes gene_type:complete
LNGYWEIDHINRKKERFEPKGNAPLYDHYFLEYPNGILNKVEMRLDRIIYSSKDIANFKIEKLDKIYYIRFKSRWSEWSKKIKYLDSHKLILEHNKSTYHYKRPTLFEFVNDETRK